MCNTDKTQRKGTYLSTTSLYLYKVQNEMCNTKHQLTVAVTLLYHNQQLQSWKRAKEQTEMCQQQNGQSHYITL